MVIAHNLQLNAINRESGGVYAVDGQLLMVGNDSILPAEEDAMIIFVMVSCFCTSLPSWSHRAKIGIRIRISPDFSSRPDSYQAS